MPPATPKQPHTEARLASLETSYGQLHDDVQGLRKDFGLFASEIRSALTDIRKTPWGDMAKWASVIVTIIALIGGLVAFGLNTQSQNLRDQFQRHQVMEAHAGGLKEMGRNEARIEMLQWQVNRLLAQQHIK